MEDFSVIHAFTDLMGSLCFPLLCVTYFKEHTSLPHFAEQEVERCKNQSKYEQLISMWVRTDVSLVPWYVHIAVRLHLHFLVTLVLVKVVQEWTEPPCVWQMKGSILDIRPHESEKLGKGDPNLDPQTYWRKSWVRIPHTRSVCKVASSIWL